MYRLYEDALSGNCYKVRLLLTQLDVPFERVQVDVVTRQTRTPAFLAKNPNGRVPTLELEPGLYLAESNAILWYLGEGTPFVPADRLERAQVLQWMFFEQYSHEPYIATSRYWIVFLGKAEEYREQLAQKREPGYAALRVMELHLTANPFLVAGRYTIADIALYAYTHVAGEGGFDLAGFPAVRAWLGRVERQPSHVAITA
jgi:glutathione S-transferase